MIKSWEYNYNSKRYSEIKNIIKDSGYTSIDIGAYANYWSYPECTVVADTYEIQKDGVKCFKLNIEDKSTWTELLNYVDTNGKFNFSICSHTLEDVFNPFDLAELLELISERGFIAIPSKYDEFTHLFNNKYRGNAHHKQFFDMIDDNLVVFPKFSWIETDDRSDNIIRHDKGRELSLLWEGTIPLKVFNSGLPFNSDEQLINHFYNILDN